MKTDWEIGDWCFSEFELKQITDIRKYKDGNAITSVTDGMFNHSGSFLNDVCYPMDLKIKGVSDFFKSYEKKLQNIDDENIIAKGEYSSVYREIVTKWCKCCDDIEDNNKIMKHYSELSDWYIFLMSGVKGLRKEKLKSLKEKL